MAKPRTASENKAARAQAAAGYTRDLMCARTIGVYEELLFPEPGAGVVTQPERMSIVA